MSDKREISRYLLYLAKFKSLLKVHTPIEYIIAATGWTEEEILKLAEE